MKLEIKSAVLCAAGSALIVILTSAFKSAMAVGTLDATHVLWLIISSQMAADLTGNPLNTSDVMHLLNPVNYLFSPMAISAFLGYLLGDILATTRRKPAIQKRNKKKSESRNKNLGRAALEYKAITGNESFLSDVMSAEDELLESGKFGQEGLSSPVDPF